MLRDRRGSFTNSLHSDNKKGVLLAWVNWPSVKIAKKVGYVCICYHNRIKQRTVFRN